MIRFELDGPGRVRIATFEGIIEDDEMVEAYRRLMSSEDYDPTLNHLADLRAVEQFNISSLGLRQLTRRFSPIDELRIQTKLAIVAVRDDVFGMARMYQTLRDDAPQQIQVFRDMVEAQHWLGLGSSEQ